jgi:dienelactone hydrolase
MENQMKASVFFLSLVICSSVNAWSWKSGAALYVENLTDKDWAVEKASVPETYYAQDSRAQLAKTTLTVYIHRPQIMKDQSPVIVYLGGCNGWDNFGTNYMIEHIGLLKKLNLPIVHVDYMGTRGVTGNCEKNRSNPKWVSVDTPGRDLVATIRWMKQQPWVDPVKIGVFGFSMGAGAATFVSAYYPNYYREVFGDIGPKAVFAVYPEACTYLTKTGAGWNTNIQIVGGEEDDESGIPRQLESCKKVKINKANLEADIHLYPGVYHSYWHESVKDLSIVRRGDGSYVRSKYDKEAKLNSIKRLYDWMNKYLVD